MDKQYIGSLYKQEQFIVIDDPISSFDFENRIGVLTYLKSQLRDIVIGNNNSKIVIFSHDLTTVFDLRKAMEEIAKATKGIQTLASAEYCCQEMHKQQMQRFKNKYNEYQHLFEMVFQYAKDKTDESGGLSIGNIMRRVLEAFSTFIYKKGIDDLSTSKEVLDSLDNHSHYFENLMYRLVLHGESHSEERVYEMADDMHFYHYISDDEKQITARSILCMMYLLQPQHVSANLQSASIKEIKKWCQTLPKDTEIVNTSDYNNTSTIIENQVAGFVKKNRSEIREIKLYELPVSAGAGTYSYEDLPHTDYETEIQSCAYAVRVAGDSMKPDINDRDILFVRSCFEPEFGKIGIFHYDGQMYCKRLKRINGIPHLVSANPLYAPIPIVEGKRFEMQGVVIESKTILL